MLTRAKDSYRHWLPMFLAIAIPAVLVLAIALPSGTSYAARAVGRLVDPLTGTWGIEPGKYIIADCNGEKELEFEIFNEGSISGFSIEGARPDSVILGSGTSKKVKVMVTDCLPLEITVLKLNQGNVQARLEARVEIEQ